MFCDCMLYINTPVYSSEKAGLLVTRIKDKVKLNLKNYHKFLTISVETRECTLTETCLKVREKLIRNALIINVNCGIHFLLWSSTHIPRCYIYYKSELINHSA